MAKVLCVRVVTSGSLSILGTIPPLDHPAKKKDNTVFILKFHTENLNFEKENTKHSVREVTNFSKGGN